MGSRALSIAATASAIALASCAAPAVIEDAELATVYDGPAPRVRDGLRPLEVEADGDTYAAAIKSALGAFGVSADMDGLSYSMETSGGTLGEGMAKAAEIYAGGTGLTVTDITGTGLEGIHWAVANGGLVVADIGRGVVVYGASDIIEYYDPAISSEEAISDYDFAELLVDGAAISII